MRGHPFIKKQINFISKNFPGIFTVDSRTLFLQILQLYSFKTAPVQAIEFFENWLLKHGCHMAIFVTI